MTASENVPGQGIGGTSLGLSQTTLLVGWLSLLPRLTSDWDRLGTQQQSLYFERSLLKLQLEMLWQQAGRPVWETQNSTGYRPFVSHGSVAGQKPSLTDGRY